MFGLDGKAKSVSTPLASHFKLIPSMSPRTDIERKQMADIPYANVVGALMYTMVCIRTYISHAISIVSRYMHDPRKEHWMTVKWIVQYI